MSADRHANWTRVKHIRAIYCDCDGAGLCSGCCLFSCSVCAGAEGSLTTDCPGRLMTEKENDAVYAGRLDFVSGEWIT